MNFQIDIQCFTIFNKKIYIVYFRYIQHTVSEDQICMQINPGDRSMPSNPSHATVTVESRNPETKLKEIKR